MKTFPGSRVKLVESSGGAFEVSVDGHLLYSKLKTGRHAEPEEVVELIRAHQAD